MSTGQSGNASRNAGPYRFVRTRGSRITTIPRSRCVRTSRPKSKQAPEIVKKYVAFGCSVRAAQYLVLGAKARALTSGRYHVSFDDIRAVAHSVMRHRVLTNFHAQSEGITSDSLIDKLLEAVPAPRSGM